VIEPTSQRWEAISGWLSEPPDPCPALSNDVRADVAVLGGGYTGLCAALSLRDQGVDVVVLERGFAGSGASGRNAGHLTPTIGKDLPTLLRAFGRERARALVELADEAVGYTEHVIRSRGISCAYEPNGNVLAAVHPSHEARLRRAADTARALGGRLRFLPSDEMRERRLPATFLYGVLEARGGILDPGKYVLGLRRRAIDAGVKLFENTSAQEIEEGRTVRITCENGVVTADSAIVATNAYTPGLGFMKRKVVPLRVLLFETHPLSAEDFAAIGWSGREGIYSSHEVLESYRLTARQTIVGGSKVVRYGFGSKLVDGHDARAMAKIERAFRERFPSLDGTGIHRWWGGWIGFTTDFLPTIGTTKGNVHYGFGYAGHGVAQATLMGAMLAERVFGSTHELEAPLRRRVWSWPPEPLRYGAYRAITQALYAMDARTDRRARRTPTAAAPKKARPPSADATARRESRRGRATS